mgnify:CR=1 FL=1
MFFNILWEGLTDKFTLGFGFISLLKHQFMKNQKLSTLKFLSIAFVLALFLIPLNSEAQKKKVSFKTKVIWVWLVTVAVIVLAFSFFGGNLFGWQKAVYILLRSFLILMLWYLVLGPFLLKLVRKYLNKKESVRFNSKKTNTTLKF